MIISSIAAMGSNRAIGKAGDLPWHLPEDFKYFKDKTAGHIIIMGRKTYESLPKPLPNRFHIVITRNENYRPQIPDGTNEKTQVHTVTTVTEAIQLARLHLGVYGQEVFCIGGAEIYTQMMPFVNKLYLTEIDRAFDGDAFFPDFNKHDFIETERRPGKESIPYDFVVYTRKTTEA